MLTESCRAQDSEISCDQLRLGDMSFASQYSFIAPGSVPTHSAPGYRITKYIDPSNFSYVDLERYIENQEAVKAHAIAIGEPAPEVDGHYRVRVYIYCPPCACQIATALDICRYRDKRSFVDFCIRIDHRQMTSCSASVSRIEGLINVNDYLKEAEKQISLDDVKVEQLKSFDREWLERQIYDYTEEDRLATLSPEIQLARIAEFHKSEASCAGIILLGETDYCVPLMGVPPFPPFEPGRLLRETQLYQFSQVWSNRASRHKIWERHYMGTYSPKTPLPPKQPTQVRSGTMQTLESAQRGPKRPRSSNSEGVSSSSVI